MKLLYLLFFVATSQASLVINQTKGYDYEVLSRESRSIASTYIHHAVTYGPPFRIEFFWHPVPSPPWDPIRGYKVKLWEEQKRIVSSMELVDGVNTTVEREELIPFPIYNSIPDGDPREELTLPGSTSNMAEFRNLIIDLWYEVRIQAYTLNEFGPYSPVWRLRFNSPGSV